MIYRTLNGKPAGKTVSDVLQKDLLIVREKCFVIENGYNRLYKIPDLEHLIPLIYGRYKITEFTFPMYLIEHKPTHSFYISRSNNLTDAINEFMKNPK